MVTTLPKFDAVEGGKPTLTFKLKKRRQDGRKGKRLLLKGKG